ncbi:MAG: hypothetical protein ABEK16_03675 [Candidatus Nanohalobium sp.]
MPSIVVTVILGLVAALVGMKVSLGVANGLAPDSSGTGGQNLEKLNESLETLCSSSMRSTTVTLNLDPSESIHISKDNTASSTATSDTVTFYACKKKGLEVKETNIFTGGGWTLKKTGDGEVTVRNG